MAKLTKEQREAMGGMDARPGPSTMPDSYFEKVCPPDIAKKLLAERRGLRMKVAAE